MYKEASKNMSLSNLIQIRDNQYRSKCNKHEYYPETVDDQIYRKQAKQNILDQKQKDKELQEIANERRDLKHLCKALRLYGKKNLGEYLLNQCINKIESRLIDIL